MKQFVDFAIYGLGAGGAYALIGLGVVVIHRGSGILNFAQGAIAMFSAFTFNWLVTARGFAPWLAALVVVALATLFGPLVFVGLFRPIRKAPLLAKVVLTIGLLGVLEGLADKVFNTSAELLVLPSLLPSHKLHLLGATVGADRIWVLILTIVVALVLWSVFRFTRFGLATRAVAENELGAAFLG
jgi:branched-chain amino acid transport system permease protein